MKTIVFILQQQKFFKLNRATLLKNTKFNGEEK